MSVQMQARSSTDGQLYTWVLSSADYSGTGFPGPGTAQDVAVAMRQVAGGGGGGSGDLKSDGSVAMAANFNLATHKILGLVAGSASGQAVEYDQLNSAIAAATSTVADWKQSVKAATTAALAANTRSGNVLTASANGAFPNQDGVAIALNDSVLVKDEATGANRGIYTLTTVGSGGAPWQLTRRADSDSNAEVTAGLTVAVEQGTVNGPGGTGGGNLFMLTTTGSIVVNTTALTFSRIGVTLPDGTMLTVNGSGQLIIATGGVGTTQLAAGAVTGPKLSAPAAAGAEPLWDGTQWLHVGRKTGAALADANATLQYATAAQYIWPAGVDATVDRVLTLGTTGLAAKPMAGVGCIINLFFFRTSYGHKIDVVNGGAGAGTIFTLPAGYGLVGVSCYYDGTNWSFAGQEDLSTPAAA